MHKRKKKRGTWGVPRVQHPKFPGFTVRITELKAGGNLYVIRMVNGKQKMTSLKRTRADLGHTTKAQEQAARALGLDLIVELAEGKDPDPAMATVGEAITLKALADTYEARAFFGQTSRYRQEQCAKVRCVATVLGAGREVRSLRPSDVAQFTAHRKTTDGVRQGTIHGDLVAVKIACNWAVAEGLLAANPLAGVKLEHERTPRRPWASVERYGKLKEAGEKLPPAFAVLLDLAWGTGRRISAILTLRWQDVTFETSKECPHGSIQWYAGRTTNNKAHEQTVPMNTLARAALERWREQCPGIGAAWVFPASKDRTKRLSRFHAKRWLRKAEILAELEHMEHGGWHMFRRGWATARKHLPLVDVAQAGGWRDTATVIKAYQHPDPKTTLAVVNGAR